jgi:2-aminoadipate transaminase
MSEARRTALSRQAERLGLPIVEDNPYGDLWFDAPPPAPLTALNPQGFIYLGSLSKVLAPGLRLVAKVMKDGFLDQHVPTIRARYKSQRDAMLEALAREMPAGDSDSTLTWNTPSRGMFLWARLPKGLHAVDFLPLTVAQGVAFVPGAPFYADHEDPRTLRLSFVTPSVEEIHRGVAALAAAYKIYAAGA